MIVEYAGPAARQVGNLPRYEVRAWWTVSNERALGNVKRAAVRELKRHITADHVEYVTMDMDTYNHPHMNAMITYRVLTAEQFAHRAELRKRVYKRCDGCGGDSPGQVVQSLTDADVHVTPSHRTDYGATVHAVRFGRQPVGPERALCFTCWHPIKDTCKVLHWINRHGKLSGV